MGENREIEIIRDKERKTHPPRDRNREIERAGAPGIQGEEKRQTIPEGDIAIEIYRGPEREDKTPVAAGRRESETPSLPVHHWIPPPNTKFVG